MTNEASDPTMLVELPTSVVGALLQMNASLNAGLADSLQTMVAGSTNQAAKRDHESNAKACSMLPAGKYSAEFLGAPLVAWTLPKLFAQVVDLTAGVAPEALDRLAGMCASKRRFVARNPEAIHPGRRDLAVMKTASGWWISKNIGQKDLKRALQAMAEATGLNFGADIVFPSPKDPGGHYREHVYSFSGNLGGPEGFEFHNRLEFRQILVAVLREPTHDSGVRKEFTDIATCDGQM